MEIIVKGQASEFIVPDEVVFNLTFSIKGSTYDDVLKAGIQNVQSVVYELLLKNGFNKESMKTKSFVIREEKEYNNITQNYESNGFSFNQVAMLKFDYNKELIANMMIIISKLVNPPQYQIVFKVKDNIAYRKKALFAAYNDAKNQAQAIAEAAGKTLKCCQKVDFKPFTDDYRSITNLDSSSLLASASKGQVTTIVNVFTPEDIELSETLYCLWIAE